MGGRRLIGEEEEKVSTPWKSVIKTDGYIGKEKMASANPDYTYG